jgi:4-diphosphocytidyl-2-C-methyl-D-erythritol kinase
LSNCQLLIVIPNFEILSKEAFAKINYQQINQTSLVGLKQAIKNQDLNAIASNLHNDFEIWTLDQYPQLKEIKQKLSSMGAKASLMSGKGSTIFALFDKTQPIDQLTNYKTYQFIL